MAAWLPIALMIGGALANEQAERKVEKERNNRALAERLRQQKMGQEADAVLRASLAEQERPAVEQEQRVAEAGREQKYAQAAQPSDQEFIATPSAPVEVKSELAARMADAMARGRQQAAALARLGGRSDAQMQGGIALGRSAQDLNRIGNTSRSSSAILPYELQAANSKGEGWRTVADLFNLGSAVTGMYGMTAAPAASSVTATNTGLSGARTVGSMYPVFQRAYGLAGARR